MSLLLDALKKAAEQKAEKTRQEVQEARSSDETEIDAAPDDISELARTVDSSPRQPGRTAGDETELDSSEFETRLERTQVEPEDGTETRLEIHDTTETQSLSAQMQTGEDETIIIADDDVSEFLGEPELVRHETRAPEDETDLSRLAAGEDETEVGELAPRAGGDETDLSQLAGREDETEVGELASRAGGDETDLSQLAGREDETEVGELATRAGGDETDLSQLAGREDETEVGELATRAGGDETDLSQLAGREDETEVGELAPRAGGDETDLSQLAGREDETEVGELATRAGGDETDLSQLAGREDETEVGELAPRAGGDETDLSQLAGRKDETEVGELATRAGGDETDLSQLAAREDDTDISQPLQPAEAARQAAAEDETNSQDQMSAGDQTDISLPPASVADLEYLAAQRAADEETDISQFVEPAADSVDEDMSLLLVERDQTNLTNPTSLTDPQRSGDQAPAVRGDSSDDEKLELVDSTRHRLPPATSSAASETQTSATATTGIGHDTQTTANSTTRTEATSTRTYAPDNYDRTLMRLPSDDASKLFAGMKSDSDVVMTPEYAKKVFHSKSSAQRVQHYKFYSGIAAVILLTILIYELFEYQDQSNTIDNSLRALKRDPMPGIIKPGGDQQSSSLFSEDGVDVRTIDIIESADNVAASPIADARVIAEAAASEAALDETEPAVQIETVTESDILVEPDTEVAMAEMQAENNAAAVGEAEAAATSSVKIATAGQAESAADPTAGSSSTLQLSSDRQVDQKDVWLREAYAAYKAGNDELALSLYNQVLGVDPANRNALLARAAIHVQDGNSVAAIRDYQSILLANPKDSLAMASLLAVANYSPRETETQLKLMIRDEPDSPYLNFALGNAYGAQDRWREAQGHYFRALQGNPGDPNYAYNLAVSLEHISQPRSAIDYYRRALANFGNGLATFNRDAVDQRLEMLGKL